MRAFYVLFIFCFLTAHILSVLSQLQQPESQSQSPAQRQARRRPPGRPIGARTGRPAVGSSAPAATTSADSVAPQQRRVRAGLRRTPPLSYRNGVGAGAGAGTQPIRQLLTTGAVGANGRVQRNRALRGRGERSGQRGPSRRIAPAMRFDLSSADMFGMGELQCVPKPANLSFCSGIGYNMLRLPNRFQHQTPSEVVSELEAWKPLVTVQACHANLAVLLCTVIAPVCIESHRDVEVLPCREICREVRESCEPVLLARGGRWFDSVLNCDNMSAEGGDHCLSREMARTATQLLRGITEGPSVQNDESPRTTRSIRSTANQRVCSYCLVSDGRVRIINQLKQKFCRAFNARRGPLAVALVEKQRVTGTATETRATVTRVLFQNTTLWNNGGAEARAQQTLLSGSEMAFTPVTGPDNDCVCGAGPFGREVPAAASRNQGAGQNSQGARDRNHLVLIAEFDAKKSTWTPIALSAVAGGQRLDNAIGFGNQLTQQGPAALCRRGSTSDASQRRGRVSGQR